MIESLIRQCQARRSPRWITRSEMIVSCRPEFENNYNFFISSFLFKDSSFRSLIQASSTRQKPRATFHVGIVKVYSSSELQHKKEHFRKEQRTRTLSDSATSGKFCTFLHEHPISGLFMRKVWHFRVFLVSEIHGFEKSISARLNVKDYLCVPYLDICGVVTR